MARSQRSRYVPGEYLGEGPLATVRSATARQGGPVRALKSLRPEIARTPGLSERIASQRIMLLALRGAHVVTVTDLVEEPDQVCVVMELMTGGTLRQYLDLHGPQPEDTAIHVVRHLLRGLGVVHGYDVVHGDLKLGNVLLSSTPAAPGLTARVSDFGMYRLLGPSALRVAEGAASPWTAPEVLAGSPPTFASDVFAVGGILYELAVGPAPKQPSRLPTHLSEGLRKMLARWLSSEPAQRPGDAWHALAEVDRLLPESGLYALSATAAPPQSGGRAVGAGFGFHVAPPAQTAAQVAQEASTPELATSEQMRG